MLLVCLLLAGCGAPAASTPEQAPAEQPEQTAQPEPAPEEPEAAIPEEEASGEPETQEKEVEETVPVLEVVYDDQTPMLSAILVDGAPLEGFDPVCRSYEVLIPAGRPHVPQVSAEAEAELSIC